MWTSPQDLAGETEGLRRRLAVLDSEVADLEQRAATARDQRDRVRTALEALDGPFVAVSQPTESPVVTHTGKYRRLWQWLVKNGSDRVKLSFSEIEEILGFQLPPSSRRHLPHWYGYGGSAVARAIYDAGYTASRANLKDETVEFVRRTGDSA